MGVVVIIAVLAFHPMPAPERMTRVRFTISLYKYFSFRMLWIDDTKERVENCGGWIAPSPPHGVLPLANILSMPAINAFSRVRFLGGAASIVLHTPFLRYMAAFGGAIDVSRASLMRAVNKGNCVGIVPDGIAGIFQMCAKSNATMKEELVYLKSRKGLARLSLAKGAPLVPAYSLGNTAVFRAWYDGFGIMEGLSRRLQISLFFFWGRFGLPLPFRVSISLVVGKPLVPDHVSEDIPAPTEEAIDELHGKLLEGIRECFDTFKGACGWGDRTLRFI